MTCEAEDVQTKKIGLHVNEDKTKIMVQDKSFQHLDSIINNNSEEEEDVRKKITETIPPVQDYAALDPIDY